MKRQFLLTSVLILALIVGAPSKASEVACLAPIVSDTPTGAIQEIGPLENGTRLIGAQTGLFRLEGDRLAPVDPDTPTGIIWEIGPLENGTRLIRARTRLLRLEGDRLAPVDSARLTGYIQEIGPLENGARLIRADNRTTRSMSHTEAGTIYYERVGRVLDDLEEADTVLGPMQRVPKGLLRVSAPMTLTLTCLSSAMPKFLSRYPELYVDLQMDDRRVNIIEEGFDLAVRGSDKLEDSSLIARKLMALPHVVCGAPAYFERAGTPNSPDDLKGHSCIQFTLSGHVSEWEFRQSGRSIRVPIDGRYKVTSSLAVRDAMRAGFGLSLIPWLYVREDIEQGRLRTVLNDWSTVEASVFAVYPSRRYVVAKLRAFLGFLVEELGSDSIEKQSPSA